MSQTKQAAQRKRRRKVVIALGAAGLSLSLGSSASAAIGGVNGASSAPKQLYEEEISDVSLATFHVFDRENVGTHGRRTRLAMAAGGCAGCAGCGCACGIGLYYHYTPPAWRPSRSAPASGDPPGAQT